MKVIKLINKNVPFYGSGIILDLDSIHFFKKRKIHRKDGPAIFFKSGKKSWYYKHLLYGHGNDFTISSWKKKVKKLKRKELLKIFI